MKEKLNEPIYTLTGTVIHGRGIGKHVGTPTANIAIEKKDFLPKTGVYVADILLSDKRYYGVTHIGTRPTLDNDSFVSIETYIFDFDKDIYGCTITVNLYKKCNRQSRQRLDRHGTIVVGSCETFHHYNVQGVK